MLTETGASGSVSREFCLWRDRGQLTLCCFGHGKRKQEQRCRLPAWGIAQIDALLQPASREHGAVAVLPERAGAGQDASVESFFLVQGELAISVHSLSGFQELWLPGKPRRQRCGSPKWCI